MEEPPLTLTTHCLFCVKKTTTTNSPQESQPYQTLELAQLMSINCKFEGSVPHENLQAGDTTKITHLCTTCCEIIVEIRQIQDEISQLQSQIRSRISLVRRKILNSEVRLKDEGPSSSLPLLESIRNVLLDCSAPPPEEEPIMDEGQSQNDVKIEVLEDDFICVIDDQELGDHHHVEGIEDSSFGDFAIFPDEDVVDKEVVDKGAKQKERVLKLILTRVDEAKVQVADSEGDDGKASEDEIITRPYKRRLGPSTRTRSKAIENEADEESVSPKRKMGRVIHSDDSDSSSSNNDTDSESDASEGEEDVKISRGPRQPWPCTVCNKIFTGMRPRDIHARKEHGVKNYSCSICEKKFMRRDYLAAHMVIKHETEDKPFTCPRSKCGKKFTLEINLERHVDLHKLDVKCPLVCDTCDSRFPDQTRLDKHATLHTKKLVPCEVCEKKFKSATLLERHKKEHMMEPSFACDHCDATFIYSRGKDRHMAKHHPNQSPLPLSLLCELCGREFVSPKKLRLHVHSVHEQKRAVKCDLCGAKCSSSITLKTHKIAKHGDDPYICDGCGTTFMTFRGLESHRLSHGEERPYKCDFEQCDAAYVTSSSLNTHKKTHLPRTDERPRLCPHCGKAFKSKTGLAMHTKITHTEGYIRPTPFQCAECGKAYHNRALLNGHVRKSHSGERPFVCQICEKGFTTKAHLQSHLTSHGIGKKRVRVGRVQKHVPRPVTCDLCGVICSSTVTHKTHKINEHGEDPFVCEECGSKFATRKGLECHKVKHSGIKAFQCEVCDARFFHKNDLKSHSSVHSNERPNVCQHCGDRFKVKKGLENHINSVHTPGYVPPTPFQCGDCDKAFRRRDLLLAHTRQQHTGERPFSCHVCEKDFTVKTRLQVHLKRTHGIGKGNVQEVKPGSSRVSQRSPRRKLATKKRRKRPAKQSIRNEVAESDSDSESSNDS